MKVALSVLVGLLLSFSLQAQSSLLKGLTKDFSGALLSGVSVEAIDPDSTIVSISVSDSVGRYSMDPLPPGTYMIRASKEGYNRYQMIGVMISERRITFMDIRLTPIGWKAPKEPKKKRLRLKR